LPFSRYYLNCSIESRYATYTWYHEDALVRSCNSSHAQRGCFHFIPSVGRQHYGHYVCVSEEDGFRQALVKERLLDRLGLLSRRGGTGAVPAVSWSLLVMVVAVVVAKLFH
ncbi:SEM7A protein, partial [Malurus elegans]|nr:SEM7A protein [Malurus elegans]